MGPAKKMNPWWQQDRHIGEYHKPEKSEHEWWSTISPCPFGNGLERGVGLRNVRLCESVTPRLGEDDKFAEKEGGE